MAKKIVDPETGGGAADLDNNSGNELTPEIVKGLIAESAAAIRAELNKAVTGAVHRNVTEAFKAPEFVDSIKGLFSGVLQEHDKAKTPKEPPSDVDALKSQITTLSGLVQTESQARKAAEQRAAAQSLDNGIMSALNALDGKEGRPRIKQEVREPLFKLLRDGHNLPGKPELGDNGTVIVRQPDGEAKPLAALLGNGYFGQDHWAVDRFQTTGSGARQSSGSSPAFDWGKQYGTPEGDAKLAEQYKDDPDGLVDALQRQANAKG